MSELDPTCFGDDAWAYFLALFRKEDELMSDEPLYWYFQVSQNKMRSLLVPLFPKDFMKMKSGRGFHETCHNIVVAQFWKEYVNRTNVRLAMSQAEADQMILPSFWDFKKPPWTSFLCVKSFRRHPHLAFNVVEILNDIAYQPGRVTSYYEKEGSSSSI